MNAIENARDTLLSYSISNALGFGRTKHVELAEALSFLLDSLECKHLNFQVNGFSKKCTDCGETL